MNKVFSKITANFYSNFGGNYEAVSAYMTDDSQVNSFLKSTPDLTAYHSRAYIEYSKAINKYSDLIVIKKGGRPLIGIPLHYAGKLRFNTDYSGLLFPPFNNERSLKPSIDALVEFIKFNKNLSLNITQSCLSKSKIGNDFHKRQEVIKYLISRHFDINQNIYTKIIERSFYETNDYGRYKPELKNQIRKAEKQDFDIKFYRTSICGSEIYESLYPLFIKSRKHTKLRVKSLQNLIALSNAIVSAGGEVVIVVISSKGRPISVVTTHIFNKMAIYWENFSDPDFLNLCPNQLAMHHSIKESFNLGALNYEIGRSNLTNARNNPKELSLLMYKSQFGGDIYQVIEFTPRSISKFKRKIILPIFIKIRDYFNFLA
jgi:hypothetical protein